MSKRIEEIMRRLNAAWNDTFLKQVQEHLPSINLEEKTKTMAIATKKKPKRKPLSAADKKRLDPNTKDKYGPWVKLKDTPQRHGMVDDWRGDGPYEVQFGDGSSETHIASNVLLVTQEKFEKWQARA